MDVLFDHCRKERIGLPETVFCQGNPLDTLAPLMREQAAPEATPLLFTRLYPEIFEMLPADAREAVVAVPTSGGYGAAEGGRAARNAMLSSCALGVCVLNIDNGHGAACAAARIIGAICG